MIKRIKRIANIGKFRSCRPSTAVFTPFTLIYGRNTYGKTTLGEILASISSGETIEIARRKSIPLAPHPMEAQVTFQCDDGKEREIQIQNGKWEGECHHGFSIKVYDDAFYHKVLFSARNITRENKERFSEFVIGETGVLKAKEIAEKKQLKGQITREKGKMEKDVFVSIEDMKAFISIVPDVDKVAAEKNVEKLRAEYAELSDVVKNAEVIRNRKSPQSISIPENPVSLLNRLDEYLRKNIENIHEAAKQKLDSHVNSSHKENLASKTWIRQGLNLLLENECPFCGQSLSGEALRLIDAYKDCFNDAYQSQLKEINTSLDSILEQITEFNFNSVQLVIANNRAALNLYKELAEKEEFGELYAGSEAYVGQIEYSLPKLIEEYRIITAGVLDAIKRKREAPHEIIRTSSYEAFDENYNQFERACNEYDKEISKINTIIDDFKNTTQTRTLHDQLQSIKASGLQAAKILKRIELSNQCQDYVGYLKRIKELEIEIPRLQGELDVDQSQYLSKYFEVINNNFRKFGSKDFELEKALDNAGHTPLYHLKVKYCGHTIVEKDIDKVFSESDRRALSLAVFWSGISMLSPEEAKNTIVVMDDPITSFDRNRMTLAHKEFIEATKNVRQVVVLSHYEQAISNILSSFRTDDSICLIEIISSGSGSDLKLSDKNEFVKSELDKRREKLMNFSKNRTNECGEPDLRIFFENEISARFAHIFHDNGAELLQLGDKIDLLMKLTAINQRIGESAHMWRKIFNPSHHMFMPENIEDLRSNTEALLTFVYTELNTSSIN